MELEHQEEWTLGSFQFPLECQLIQEQLLDETYNPNQIYVQSSDVLRTLQSGYSELMGFYPPINKNLGETKQQTTKPNLSILTSGEIRSLKQGKEQNFNDDTIFAGCQWANQRKVHNEPDPTAYTEVSADYLEVLKEPIQKAFNLTDQQVQNFGFPDLSSYGDKFRCEDFQGDIRRFNFTPTEIYYLRTLQRDSLSIPCGEKGRQLFMTKQFSKPIEAMKKMMSQLINGEDTRDSLRFFFYSAHDDTPANAMPFLNPLNYILVDVPYGSSFTYELRYNEDCLNDKTTSADEKRKCFKVHSLYNNNPLRFDTCEQNVNSNQSSGKKALKVDSKLPVCLFDDFLSHIQKASYQGDVKEACSQPYIPGQE
eukprot:403343716